jgi:hypothetical protein
MKLPWQVRPGQLQEALNSFGQWLKTNQLV